MCVERFTVSVSSPALSFLMYDCANRDTDFEGLIFGSVTTRQVCDVSDEANSDTTVKEITEVCIQRFVFLEARFSFYEPNLNVNSDLIHMLLQTLSTSIENVSVLGWFRLKRNVGPVGFSRIERRVTASLSSITDASKDGLRTPLFMLLSESVENKHDYGETGYQLFQYDPHFCRFRPIRLIVTNIGSTNQAEYQQSPLAFGAPSLSIIPHSIADFPSTVYNYASTLMQNSMTQLKTICQSLLVFMVPKSQIGVQDQEPFCGSSDRKGQQKKWKYLGRQTLKDTAISKAKQHRDIEICPE
ncbi:unnamed protein product [Soboliphyme baturini]|uniref:BRCA1-A complex subunit Abraxas 1 n=1 Tax=Soboliphyme baturini TaxID=241478 RepID=A0A183J155_9BILA|nr:unnamed protein product [Soboliphyme baturini]